MDCQSFGQPRGRGFILPSNYFGDAIIPAEATLKNNRDIIFQVEIFQVQSTPVHYTA